MSYMPPEFAHAPMLITHFGSSICSYRRCTTGAIFMKQVPAITIKSAWRGDARMTSAPNRARSWVGVNAVAIRSEEHTSELQSLMRISYAVFCLKNTKSNTQYTLQQEN